MTNAGTIRDPLTLTEALTTDRISAGDIVYLRGGTYTLDANVECVLVGAAGNPVTVKPYPGERVAIDCNGHSLTISGEYQTWRDIRFTNSAYTTRISAYSGSSAPDMGPLSIDLMCPGVRFEGCVWDNLTNFGLWKPATAAVLIDCVAADIGWIGSDGYTHGHALYAQNISEVEAEKRIIQNLMVGPTFDYGVGLKYQTSPPATPVRWFELSQIFSVAPIMMKSCEHISFDDLVLWRAVMQLGNAETDTGSSIINSFFDLTDKFEITTALAYFTFSANTIRSSGFWADWDVAYSDGVTWDNNAYYNSFYVYWQETLFTALADWQAGSGLDAASSYSASNPSALTRVWPCTQSDIQLAHLLAIDYSAPTSIDFDISGLSLAAGIYTIRSLFDLHGDVYAINYDGNGTLTLSMQNRSVSVPNGHTESLMSVPAELGCWILEKSTA